MFFRNTHLYFPIFLLIFNKLIQFNDCEMEAKFSNCNSSTIFLHQTIESCSIYEYYNFDLFKCIPCNKKNYLEAKTDRTACQCIQPAQQIALYDSITQKPICSKTRNITLIDNINRCKYKYINITISDEDAKANIISSSYQAEHHHEHKHIQIYQTNPFNTTQCEICNLKYNYRYHDYCIENSLMKPYLKYNSFMPITMGNQFSDLKYVAFFCLALHNATACNRLANLCIQTFYSFDKYSPCSPFLMAQEASETIIKYANMNDDYVEDIKPFLFYKKGTDTMQLFAYSITSNQSCDTTSPSTTSNNDNYNFIKRKHLEFFSTTHALDGSLRRWGTFSLSQINLCGVHTLTSNLNENIPYGYSQQLLAQCTMKLEHLIDLAKLMANNYFLSLYYNYSAEESVRKPHRTLLQVIPVLIDNLTTENKKNNPKDWHLVKRFQMLEAHPITHFTTKINKYDDKHKLGLYRSIRYVEQFELHYKIYENNHIGIPLIKLHYKNIIFGANMALNDNYKYQLLLTYEKVNESSERNNIIINITLPLLFICAFCMAVLRLYNWKKRQTSTTITANDICDITCFSQFLLHLISYLANILLICICLHIISNSIVYLTQRTIEITLPIEKNTDLLQMIIYVAFILKFIYLCIYFWRISHYNMFLIDWERPKCNDNIHFNLKSNLETSSLCSSVRTFVPDNNVSAWRILFIANEWARLSDKQKTSAFLQGILLLLSFEFFNVESLTQEDETLEMFILIVLNICIYLLQLFCYSMFCNHQFGNPIEKFVDRCSLSNVSVFVLLEASYGFYIHGRSPHGFSDTDMLSLSMQLQRESQNMCSKRGLLSDSDQQTYIVIPPMNMREYFEKLLLPLQRARNVSQIHYQKEINSIECATTDKRSAAYSSINRLFCAFIDHAIKDMDYIIKEKTLLEKLFNCEFDKCITENKGTFYIDNGNKFSKLFLHGNSNEIFIIEFLLLLLLYTLTANLTVSTIIVCLINKIFKYIFRNFVLQNVSSRTIIDRRFLM